MKLKKCEKCRRYTLREVCQSCNEKTKEAHYKFIKLRDEKENIEK